MNPHRNEHQCVPETAVQYPAHHAHYIGGVYRSPTNTTTACVCGGYTTLPRRPDTLPFKRLESFHYAPVSMTEAYLTLWPMESPNPYVCLVGPIPDDAKRKKNYVRKQLETIVDPRDIVNIRLSDDRKIAWVIFRTLENCTKAVAAAKEKGDMWVRHVPSYLSRAATSEEGDTCVHQVPSSSSSSHATSAEIVYSEDERHDHENP
jgi:hypothetical protein